MISIDKKQLKKEILMIKSLINRYGGDISLWTAHDTVTVTLDFYRGAGVQRKRKSVIKISKRSINHGCE